jgi:alpha-ribazole phosphatase
MSLRLIRHPAPEVEAGVCYGRLDLPLKEPAGPVITAIAARLPPISRVISSPATRCRRLAEVIAAARDLEVHIDPRWQELDFGAWEGHAWTAIPRALSDPWAENYWDLAPPDGETYRALTERVTDALAALDPAEDVAIVTHAGPIRVALAWALGWDARVQPAIEIGYGAIVGLRRASDGWVRC